MSTVPNTSQPMSNLRSTEDHNKQVTGRFIEQVWNRGNLDQVGEFISANHKNHPLPSGPDFGQGPSAIVQLVNMYRTAYPDTKLTIDDQIAQGDQVATRWTATGTHQGEMFGMPPTGKKVKVTGIFIDRVIDGKIVETWGEFDALGMMQQLGVIPAPGH